MSITQEQAEKFRGVTAYMLEGYREAGALDSIDLLDCLTEEGILEPVEAAGPCGDNCACAECGDFPQTCYRLTEAGKVAQETDDD